VPVPVPVVSVPVPIPLPVPVPVSVPTPVPVPVLMVSNPVVVEVSVALVPLFPLSTQLKTASAIAAKKITRLIFIYLMMMKDEGRFQINGHNILNRTLPVLNCFLKGYFLNMSEKEHRNRGTKTCYKLYTP
jgi:hypothetical protein